MKLALHAAPPSSVELIAYVSCPGNGRLASRWPDGTAWMFARQENCSRVSRQRLAAKASDMNGLPAPELRSSGFTAVSTSNQRERLTENVKREQDDPQGENARYGPCRSLG